MSFLDKLQSANESVKRRWMIFGTAAVMLVVIFVWVSYFDNLIGDAGNLNKETAERGGGSELSFSDTISGGVSAVLDKIKSFFSSPKDYIIKP